MYEVLQLINEMRDQGILPNRCTYNAVISRLCKEKKPEKAWELIPVMLKSNLLPEAVIYSTIIDGFGKQLNSRKGLHFVFKNVKSWGYS